VGIELPIEIGTDLRDDTLSLTITRVEFHKHFQCTITFR